MVRLKYTNVDGKLVSKEVVANGNLLVVRIDPSQLRFRVTNVGGEHLFSEGSAANLTYLKTKAKNALKELGVSFTAEVRNRVRHESEVKAD